jgi:hypothetical protein
MAPPFSLTNALIEELRAGQPEIFLDCSLEFFRLMA